MAYQRPSDLADPTRWALRFSGPGAGVDLGLIVGKQIAVAIYDDRAAGSPTSYYQPSLQEPGWTNPELADISRSIRSDPGDSVYGLFSVTTVGPQTFSFQSSAAWSDPAAPVVDGIARFPVGARFTFPAMTQEVFELLDPPPWTPPAFVTRPGCPPAKRPPWPYSSSSFAIGDLAFGRVGLG